MRSITREQQFLLQSVEKWFNRSEQVSHYVEEQLEGPTIPEQFLLQQLPHTGAVLDVGCGAGRISMFLAEKGYKVTGIDISEALLHNATELSMKRALDIQYLVVNGTDLPFSDKTYDMITAFKVLCYIPTSALREQYLQKLYHILKPGGLLLLTQNIVPDEYIDESQDEHYINHPASKFVSLEQGDNFPLGVGYVHWFTERQLFEQISRSAFTIELFESDKLHHGDGFLRLIKLRKK